MEFKFEYMVFNNFETIKGMSFFNQQELFMGHSMVNIHMNDLDEIDRALKIKDILSNKYTLYWKALYRDPQRIAKFKNQQIMRDILLVNNDFQMDNEIERALYLKETLA